MTKEIAARPEPLPKALYPACAHVVLGLSDGSTRGGHLLEGTVRPTLEVVLTEAPSTLRRKKGADLGITLIDMEAAPRGASRHD